MMSISDNNPEILNYYSHSLCPDESYFQTLFSMTQYVGNEKQQLTYIDWSEGASSPKIITMDDYGKLKESDCLMARKFDMEVDEEIMRVLENHIR